MRLRPQFKEKAFDNQTVSVCVMLPSLNDQWLPWARFGILFISILFAIYYVTSRLEI